MSNTTADLAGLPRKALPDLADKLAPGDLQAALTVLEASGLSAAAVIAALLVRGDLEAREERDSFGSFMCGRVAYRLTPRPTA